MGISSQTYFQLFDLPAGFQLDQRLLTRRSQALLSQWHPDRFVEAPERERREAVQMTSIINQAYSTLRQPLSRAGYLLKLQGIEPESHQQADLNGDFLMQQMQLRDKLEETESAEDMTALDDMKKSVAQQRDELYQHIEAALASTGPVESKRLFHQLQFVEKLLIEINQTEERLLDY
jgi:molecular chaperone HscB